MLFKDNDDNDNIKSTSDNRKKLHKELCDLQRTSSKISKDEAASIEKELRKKMDTSSGLSEEEYRKFLLHLKENTHDAIDPEELRVIKKKLDL